jgi:hypothetical protein
MFPRQLAGLDLDQAVKWSISIADGGWDLLGPRTTFIDVKTTFPNYRLIWSVDVNDLYEREKAFHALVNVSIDPADFSRCWIEGWVSKRGFLQRKRVADESDGLDAGTWFLDKEDLDPRSRGRTGQPRGHP